MKKVARLRVMTDEQPNFGTGEQIGGVRTTGRIKKPKAVFDPSDNYLPRSQRQSNVAQTSNVVTALTSAIGAVTASGTGANIDRKREGESLLPQKRLSQSSINSSNCTTPSLVSPTILADNCYICNKKEPKRGIGAKNKLVACVECDIKVHKMCIKIEFDDFDVLRANYKCDNCRSCVLCSAFVDTDGAQEEEYVTCAKCIKSYHLTCHIPNVHKYQQHQKDWKCNKCSLPRIGNGNLIPVKTIREIIGDESVSAKINTIKTIDKTPQQNVDIAAAAEEAKNSAAASKRNIQVQKDAIIEKKSSDANGDSIPLENKRQKLDVPLGGQSETVLYNPNEPFEIPDVKDWTVDQVTEFFVKYFPKEAHVFKEHEIDGMSLLLLKRSDVIKKLPIKLGPSLRIYSLILKIQTQLNDPTLAWNCGI